MAAEATERFEMEEKIINGNCWVACFDMLGFKEEIWGFEKAYGVGHLNSFAEDIYKGILDALKSSNISDGEVYTFWASDTFVFYTTDDSAASFESISHSAIFFFCKMMRNRSSGMMTGALGTGQLYANKQDNIFIGSALIDAYTYAEKQDWIGFVITPSAEKKIDDIESELKIPSHTLLYNFIQYYVPVKKKELRNEIRCFVEDTELLFAAKIQSQPAIKEFFPSRRKGIPPKEWEKKYDNTRRFFDEHP